MRLLRDPVRDPSTTQPDAPALADVYREHAPFVWRTLVRLGVPRSATDDAVHDVFLVVARGLGEFRGEASLRTWLFAIAYRIALSVRRDAARDRWREERLAATPLRDAAVDPVARSEASDALSVLLDELDPEKRAVFVMTELEGMTAPEIAGALGLKVPTVHSRLRLARERLEAAIARNGGHGR